MTFVWKLFERPVQMIELGTEITPFIGDLIERIKLPDSYWETARQFYVPLAQRIQRLVQQMDRVPVVGINGGQGTGKSTCSELIAGVLEQQGIRALVVSIDDLYYPKSVRQQLAEEVHPLFITRGVPGTHEMEAFLELVEVARGEVIHSDLVIPRFDKGSDDRSAEGTPFPEEGVDVILFEGWCIGATAQPDDRVQEACNDFEREQDPDARWRSVVNEHLSGLYAEAFELIDYLIMLKPPCFEVIYEWRGVQEQRLREKLAAQGRSDSEAMNEEELIYFISHYERLTRWMFEEMPERADEVFLINEEHNVFANVRNPKHAIRYMISTDLDASLLDDSYSWAAAEPALKKAVSAKAGLVLNSSKTVSEMKALAAALKDQVGGDAPVLVAENGGTLAIPQDDGYRVECLGRSRDEILELAHGLRTEHGYAFTGFADMKPEAVVEHTGLAYEAAVMAMDRQSTEPILWNDSEALWQEFVAALEQDDLRAVRGGRFIHIMGPTDKANGMEAALAHFQDQDASSCWSVVALGDSPNDLGMLNAADIAVAISNPSHGEQLEPTAPRCVYPELPGPAGWNEAVLTILEDE
jgi:D-glycerate 3-kinase